MIKNEFQNLTDSNLGFKIYGNYTWPARSKMIVSIIDASTVDLKYKLGTMNKHPSNVQTLVATANNIASLIRDNFQEGSTGFNIEFIVPEAKPEINIEIPSNYMIVGDEMKFTVDTKNLVGQIYAYINEKDIAMVLRDGRTIRAMGPGLCTLKVGTKEYNREVSIRVGAPEIDDSEKTLVESNMKVDIPTTIDEDYPDGVRSEATIKKVGRPKKQG